jgi:hypothetical protein
MASTITAGNATNGLALSCDNTGILELKTGTGSGTTAMTIDASQVTSFAGATTSFSGNVGVGTTSPTVYGSYRTLEVRGAGGGLVQVGTGATTAAYLFQDGTNAGFNNIANGVMTFSTNNTERARIDSSGNLLVGVTSTFSTVGVTTTNTFSTSGAASWAGAFQNTNSGPVGVLVRYNTDTNGTGNAFLYCQGNATLRAEIRSNGGLANFSANNVNLSDERLKTDIQPAGSYLSKICAIPVKTFLYKDQTDSEPNLGVIAQDVEAVAPELVDASGFGETPEDGVPYKTIYQTDLQYALMKCIQEQQQMIETLQAEVAALKGA